MKHLNENTTNNKIYVIGESGQHAPHIYCSDKEDIIEMIELFVGGAIYDKIVSAPIKSKNQPNNVIRNYEFESNVGVYLSETYYIDNVYILELSPLSNTLKKFNDNIFVLDDLYKSEYYGNNEDDMEELCYIIFDEVIDITINSNNSFYITYKDIYYEDRIEYIFFNKYKHISDVKKDKRKDSFNL